MAFGLIPTISSFNFRGCRYVTLGIGVLGVAVNILLLARVPKRAFYVSYAVLNSVFMLSMPLATLMSDHEELVRNILSLNVFMTCLYIASFASRRNDAADKICQPRHEHNIHPK